MGEQMVVGVGEGVGEAPSPAHPLRCWGRLGWCVGSCWTVPGVSLTFHLADNGQPSLTVQDHRVCPLSALLHQPASLS